MFETVEQNIFQSGVKNFWKLKLKIEKQAWGDWVGG
jgi:hypothetical protein